MPLSEGCASTLDDMVINLLHFFWEVVKLSMGTDPLLIKQMGLIKAAQLFAM
jgi:hypothetical protein